MPRTENTRPENSWILFFRLRFMEVTRRKYIPLQHQKFLPLCYNKNKSILPWMAGNTQYTTKIPLALWEHTETCCNRIKYGLCAIDGWQSCVLLYTWFSMYSRKKRWRTLLCERVLLCVFNCLHSYHKMCIGRNWLYIIGIINRKA